MATKKAAGRKDGMAGAGWMGIGSRFGSVYVRILKVGMFAIAMEMIMSRAKMLFRELY